MPEMDRAGVAYTKNASTQDAIVISGDIAENLVWANDDRIGLTISTTVAAVWVRFMGHGTDGSTRKGILIPVNGTWTMPGNAVYTGGVSMINITNGEFPSVTATEW